MNEQERLHLEEVLLLLQRPAKGFVQRARKMLEHMLDDEPDFAEEVAKQLKCDNNTG